VAAAKKCTSVAGHFDGLAVRWCHTEHIAQCSMTRASPEATGRSHRATTRSVLPRWPPGRQPTQRLCKMYPLCWPFRWPSQCAGTHNARISQWRRFVAFIKATKCRHWASTRSARHQSDMPTPISGVYFIVKLSKKSLSCPSNNRGMTYQTDEKYLNIMSKYFVGVVNIPFNRSNNRFL
jgi:hypothetical protein